MIFECVDGMLGSIAAVDIRWYQLVVNVGISEKILEGGGSFVVQALELWS